MGEGSMPEPPWVELLNDLKAIRARVDDLTFNLVSTLRWFGVTWQEIADELGETSADAARRKYGQRRSHRS